VSGLKRRLASFVGRLRISSAEPIALMTDGAESLLRLKALLPIRTRFVLDYFHVSMKLRHIDQCIGVIPPTALSPDGSIFELYDRFNYLRGYLWSGQRQEFEHSVERLLELLDEAKAALPDLDRTISMASGHLCDLAGYIRKNDSGVINYGRWRKEGRRISTSGVESTVNRLIGRRLGKGQHMCWTKRGAHLLLRDARRDRQPDTTGTHGARGGSRGRGVVPAERHSKLRDGAELYVDGGMAQV
jgi:hypothetical protein